MSVCLQQATDFHAKIVYLSTLHLYLQKMLAIIIKEFKVQLLSYVDLIFHQGYYVSGKISSLQL